MKAAPNLVLVMGETASGKTAVAEALAKRMEAILINADAFQSYRYLDIGTAKPLNRSRYELIDILFPNESYGVGEFIRRCLPLLDQAYQDGCSVVVVGGSGLYVRALAQEYTELSPAPDPALREQLNAELTEHGLPYLQEKLNSIAPGRAQKTDLMNARRVIRAIERELAEEGPQLIQLPNFCKNKIAIRRNKDAINARITQRVGEMLQNGWIKEVEMVASLGYRRSDPGLQAIGYRHVFDLLDELISRKEAEDLIVLDTQRYAKRQRTWLRSEPDLEWIQEKDLENLDDGISSIINNFGV